MTLVGQHIHFTNERQNRKVKNIPHEKATQPFPMAHVLEIQGISDQRKNCSTFSGNIPTSEDYIQAHNLSTSCKNDQLTHYQTSDRMS